MAERDVTEWMIPEQERAVEVATRRVLAQEEPGQGLPPIVEARYLRDLARKVLDSNDMARAGRAHEAFNRASTFHALIRVCDALAGAFDD